MNNHRSFTVTWTIDVDACTPEEAAKLAQKCQQLPTTATVFEVDDGVTQSTVDLMEIEKCQS